MKFLFKAFFIVLATVVIISASKGRTGTPLNPFLFDCS